MNLRQRRERKETVCVRKTPVIFGDGRTTLIPARGKMGLLSSPLSHCVWAASHLIATHRPQVSPPYFYFCHLFLLILVSCLCLSTHHHCQYVHFQVIAMICNLLYMNTGRKHPQHFVSQLLQVWSHWEEDAESFLFRSTIEQTSMAFKYIARFFLLLNSDLLVNFYSQQYPMMIIIYLRNRLSTGFDNGHCLNQGF